MQMTMFAPPAENAASESSTNKKRAREEMEKEGEEESTPRKAARSLSGRRVRRTKVLKPDIAISTSVTYIFQIPLARAQEIIENIHEDFDSLITGTPEWTVAPLMRLVWLLTEVQPNQSITATRCTYYGELLEKLCSQASRRQEQLSHNRYRQLILSLTPLTIEKVNHAAGHLGFCDSWLAKPKPVPKGKAKARLALPPPAPPTPAQLNGDPSTPTHPTVAALLKATPSANDFSAPSMVLPPLAPTAPPVMSTASEAMAPAPPLTAPPHPFAAPTTRSEVIATITPTSAARADDEAAVAPTPNGDESQASQSGDDVNLLELVARKREAALLRRQAREAAAASGFVEHAEALPADASPAAAAEPVLDDDNRECVICKSPLKQGEVQALECMHVFHRECVEEYMSVGGQSFRYACPYKCFHSELAAQPEAETVVVADDEGQASHTAVVADAALLNAADSMAAP